MPSPSQSLPRPQPRLFRYFSPDPDSAESSPALPPQSDKTAGLSPSAPAPARTSAPCTTASPVAVAHASHVRYTPGTPTPWPLAASSLKSRRDLQTNTFPCQLRRYPRQLNAQTIPSAQKSAGVSRRIQTCQRPRAPLAPPGSTTPFQVEVNRVCL